MFTDADHAKAVQLWENFKDAEWWPKTTGTLTPTNATTSGWCWAGGSGCYKAIWERTEALSVIAWAMVERLRQQGEVRMDMNDPEPETRCTVTITGGKWKYFHGATMFLALAAAIENANKEA